MRDMISARLSEESQTGKLKLYLNLTKEQVDKYQIDRNQYVSVKKYGCDKSKFIIKFHSAPIPMVTHKWKVAINKVKSEIRGATVSLDPAHFAIKQTERVLGVSLPTSNDTDGVVVQMDAGSFEVQTEKGAVFLDSRAKEEMGFNPKSKWGEDLSQIIPTEIDLRIENYLKKKYS